MNYVPFYESESSNEPSSNHFKKLFFDKTKHANYFLAVINSSLFFFWYTNYSANRDVTSFDINSFPLKDTENKVDSLITNLTLKLMEDIDSKSKIREYNYSTGKVKYQEFYMRLSKPILDQIDTILAEHYGFTEAELDFIINYDIKYRMGKALFGEPDESEEDED
jgi:hypothetical protein